MQRIARVKKELQMLTESPPHGISCYPVSDDITHFEAKILGGDGTPYAGGLFKLEIDLPERYPFEPPKVQFLTPIYHPNIDNVGRICLDTLKMPPKGAWKPCLNLVTVLTSLQLLLAQPNPDDALMADIASEFKHNRALFTQKATDYTAQYAQDVIIQLASSANSQASHMESGVMLLNPGNSRVPSTSSEGSCNFLHHSQLPGSVSSGKRSADNTVHPMQDLTNKKIRS